MFVQGHLDVVKYMVKSETVSQFPSDAELTRYISTISDDKLKASCQQCMEEIVASKKKQAAEAIKNADKLLQQIDAEKV